MYLVKEKNIYVRFVLYQNKPVRMSQRFFSAHDTEELHYLYGYTPKEAREQFGSTVQTMKNGECREVKVSLAEVPTEI